MTRTRRLSATEIERREADFAATAAAWERAVAERRDWFASYGLEVPDDRDEQTLRVRANGSPVFHEPDALEEFDRHRRRAMRGTS